jgi:hypothetical protein
VSPEVCPRPLPQLYIYIYNYIYIYDPGLRPQTVYSQLLEALLGPRGSRGVLEQKGVKTKLLGIFIGGG